jgi:predicted phosphate transport protein (TIGR00153 family)
MFNRLLPRETGFFDFFEQHAAMTVRGARDLLSMASGTLSVPDAAKRIKTIEHEADDLTHRCVAALHKTFITPIDRDSIHRLITRMDDIMDFVDAAADRIGLYEVKVMTMDAVDMAAVLVKSAKEVEVACKGLRNLKNPQAILHSCVIINRLENEADAILRRAVARLFREERDPIQIIKWKEIYELMETATDRCEDVANVIEGVVLENA